MRTVKSDDGTEITKALQRLHESKTDEDGDDVRGWREIMTIIAVCE